MPFSLEHWGWGLLLALAGVSVLVGLRRRGAAPWRAERWTLRIALIATCALALAQLSLKSASRPRERIVVLDLSRSIGGSPSQSRDWVRDAVADLDPQRDRARVVLIGARPVVAAATSPPAQLLEQLNRNGLPPVDRSGSDLGAALREAARAGPGAEVLLISDGRDTGGDARLAAAQLGAAGIPLHAYAPDVSLPYGARLARLDLPPSCAPGDRLAVTVEVEATRDVEALLTLELERAGGWEPVFRVEINLTASRSEVTRILLSAPKEPGWVNLRARVRARGRDDEPRDDTLDASFRVGKQRVAWLVGQASLPRELSVRSLPPQRLAAALRGRLPDLLVLAETPARAVEAALEPLRAALASGMGLVVAGADHAFGPGGYAGSELEELLPVTAGPATSRDDPLVIVLALDASGSMAQALPGDEEARTRYQQAVSALPLERLRPEDQLALVLFAGQPQLFQPLGPRPHDLLERLLAHRPGGSTDVGAALVRALEELQGREGQRLVVLASDSRDPQPDRHLPRLRELARELEPEELRVLLVMVGRGPSTGLSTLAAALEGLAEVTRVEDTGPAWAELLEGELLARRTERRQGQFTARLTAEGQARGIGLPVDVSAFAPVRARENALTLATVLDSEAEDPPLAVLGDWEGGRVLALPLRPEETPEILAPLIPLLLRPSPAEISLRAQRRQGGLELLLEGAELPEALRVLILADGEENQTAHLEQETPGRHSAWLPRVPSSQLRVTAWASGPLATTTVPDLAQAELAELGPDYALLAALCEATGGHLLSGSPTPAEPLPANIARGHALAPLLPWLGLLALLLLLLDTGLESWQARATLKKLSAGHA